MTPTVDLDTITLKPGVHASWEDGACVMELAAYLANEPWSDHPASVSPVLGAFLRSWNDALDDTTRQRLKPYAVRVIGTANDGKDEQRAWMATDWLCRVCAPAFLDLANLHEDAAAFRALPAFTNSQYAQANLSTLRKGQKNAAAARDAALAAARDAALDAARDAALDAALDAARDAAWNAAGAAAWNAAWNAARDAALDAARAAAWNAAWAAAWNAAWAAALAAAGDAAWAAALAALKPTIQTVQDSAFQMLDRMVNPS